ncbi:MAG: DUF192 domain-containing protein [Herbaspirillum sp.]
MALQSHYLQALATSILFTALPVAAQSTQKLQTITLNYGIHQITAEVAVTDAERELGLMNRTSLGANNGMLFGFRAPAYTCMWMKNTLIPLAVAFMDEHGQVINIEEMQPQTTKSHCTERPATYALEMNQGWFSQHQIKPGAIINGLEKQR